MYIGEKNAKNLGQLFRANWLTRILVSGTVLLLILSAVVVTITSTVAEPRTSTEGNEPMVGFSEGTEIFEIYHNNDVHNTVFATNENINIRINSNEVDWAAGGPNRRNRWRLHDYDGTQVSNGVFGQQGGGPPYVYNANFQAPATSDHYLISVELRESAQQGGKNITTSDVIRVGAGTAPPKHINTTSMSSGVSPSWVLGNGETVYVQVHTPNAIEPSNSDIIFADYFNENHRKQLSDLDKSNVVIANQDSIITYSLLKDLDATQLMDNELMGGYWYTLAVDLEDVVGNQMAKDWAAQIYILPPPKIGFTNCTPTSIYAVGTETTTIYTHFYDEDAVNAAEFNVTIKARDPNNVEYIIADHLTQGPDLVITSLGGNNWNASIIWDPPDTVTVGDYDLYAEVWDANLGFDMDDYNNNQNELTLLQITQLPSVQAGNTTCMPDRINKMTNDFTVLYCNFTDTNDPPLGMVDFAITFKVRDPSNTEIIIADNKFVGQPGDAPGSGNVVMLSVPPNSYAASISWDPDTTVAEGKYDLFFSVTSPHGTATDDFDNNNDELEIYSTGNPPQLTVGDTSCIPSSVDKIGTQTTLIYCEFTDADDPPASSFNVTFKVRPPSNSNQDAITLVDAKADGGAGEFGGTVTVEVTGTKYTASYNWDPPATVDVGKYDLYFMVTDDKNNSAEDPFAQNPDELEIITSVEPPSINAGDTKCVPTSVNKMGSGTTKIYCEFTDSTYTDVADFNVTFKVRDPSNTEIILVDDKPNGVGGVEITYSGTVFTAWFEWDPPTTAEPGKYDLYFAVMNKAKGFAEDDFVNNQNELTIETAGNAPVITRTDCVPSSISVNGADTTQIFAEFTDADNPPVANFTVTFKVRDPNNQEIMLVNDKLNGGLAATGGTVEILVSGSGYMARYNWDPADDNVTGKYDLYFAVKDETFAQAEDGYDNNLNKLELTGGTGGPGTPDIQTQDPTHDGNTYTFTVTYTDAENDPPNDDGVTLVIGTSSHKMSEVDTSDTNYTGGKKYKITIPLNEGNYTYNFKVTDSNNNLYQTENFELSVTAEEEPTDKEEDNTALIIAIVAIIIIIIIVFVILGLMKRRVKPSNAPPPQRQPQPSAPPAESQAPPPTAAPVEPPKKEG